MKPTVVISACLNGLAYRYNGALVNDEIVNKLKTLFNLINVCPEFEIGLGVPRKTIKLHKVGDEIRAIQDETGIDLTQELENFSNAFLKNLGNVHGFILKAKSPSCGVGSTKVYVKNNIQGKSSGIFARTIKEKFPHIPIIDEGRLRNKELMWEFLTKVYMLFRFDNAKTNINSLIEFHSRHKYLFMSISQKHLRNLGQTIAEHKPDNFNEIVARYESIFKDMLSQGFRRSNLCNSIMHIFGHISENLSKPERSHFLKMLNKYKNHRVELTTVIEMLRLYGMRFQNDYLLKQYFLDPFPEI